MNTNRKLALATVVASLGAFTVGAASASADGDTTVSFTVAGGNLSIAAGTTATDGNADAATNLGSSTLTVGSSHVYGPTAIDDVVVTDATNLVGDWCVSVELGDGLVVGTPGFVSGANEVSGSAGSITAVGVPTGTMTAVPAVARTLDTGGDLIGGATILGGGTVTITPTLTLTVPSTTPNGTYSGTIIYTADSSACTLT